MFQNKFAEAKALYDQIIANGKNAQGVKYDLTANYNNNFRITQENNVESVFAVQYSYGDGSNFNGNHDNSLNYPHGIPSGLGAGCCGFFQPSQTLVNAFKTGANGLPMPDTFNETDVTSDDGLDATDPFTPYQGTLDPRLDWTVGRRGIPYLDWGIFPGRLWIRKQDYGGPYAPKKNVFFKSDIGTTAGSVSWNYNSNSLNFTIIRYADVLLMAAEAEIEVGSLTKAAEYINRVRVRAAASPVMNGPAPAANYLVAATDRQHNIWLRDPLAIKIFNLEMFVQKLYYMHLNPLQPHWLLCNHPAEYRFSSAIFYEQQADEFGILTNFSEVF